MPSDGAPARPGRPRSAARTFPPPGRRRARTPRAPPWRARAAAPPAGRMGQVAERHRFALLRRRPGAGAPPATVSSRAVSRRRAVGLDARILGLVEDHAEQRRLAGEQPLALAHVLGLGDAAAGDEQHPVELRQEGDHVVAGERRRQVVEHHVGPAAPPASPRAPCRPPAPASARRRRTPARRSARARGSARPGARAAPPAGRRSESRACSRDRAPRACRRGSGCAGPCP